MRVVGVIATVVVGLAIAGFWLGSAEAERLNADSGSVREQQALELAAAHWDNPLLRLVTVDQVVIGHGSELVAGCSDVDVAAVSLFGKVLDRVRVACDDSVLSLGDG